MFSSVIALDFFQGLSIRFRHQEESNGYHAKAHAGIQPENSVHSKRYHERRHHFDGDKERDVVDNSEETHPDSAFVGWKELALKHEDDRGIAD